VPCNSACREPSNCVTVFRVTMSDPAFTHDVFLSYSSKDKAVVRPLAERLQAVRKHLKVWFDEWVLEAGEQDQRTSSSRRESVKLLNVQRIIL
jgi:hypothetical protein